MGEAYSHEIDRDCMNAKCESTAQLRPKSDRDQPGGRPDDESTADQDDGADVNHRRTAAGPIVAALPELVGGPWSFDRPDWIGSDGKDV